MIKKILRLIILINLVLSWEDSEIEYIIYTNSSLFNSASDLSNLHENLVEENFQLKTKIILNDTLSTNINDYIFSNFDFEYDNLKYLCIIGDETIIPPLYYLNTPCDDCISSENINNPNAQLKTGRILASNDNEANTIINNIINYTLSPYDGDWKSKALLFCDDQFKNGQTIRKEKWHTIHSSLIYNNLKDNLNINCLFGPNFDRQQSTDWYTQPNFTNKLIQNINQGAAIINYIGHGTSEFLADEDILTYSDIDLISIDNNKLPVWVVGTCAFGNYINKNCFAERLLKKGDSAIAIISTTGGISYSSNFYFLKKFFIDNINDYLVSDANDRIGDLFYDSKENLFESYTLHLFGDPAMRIQIAKTTNNLIENNTSEILIGSENYISINNTSLSTLRILNNDINTIFNYNYNGEDYSPNDSCFNAQYNLSCLDQLSFNYNNNQLFSGEFYGSTNYTLPLDALEYNNTNLKVHNDLTNSIQSINNIDLEFLDDSLLNDDTGPQIILYQNGIPLSDNSIIYPPYNISINLSDNLPINISGLNYHDIRLWIDDNHNESIILNNFYTPISSTSGNISYIINNELLYSNSHKINLEAWDIVNNSTLVSYNLEIFNNNNNTVYNVYNFPNPFKNETFFTFSLVNASPINVNIDIYNLEGKKVNQITQYLEADNKHFYRIYWDGLDQYLKEIPNGVYIYELEVLQNDIKLHKKIYKLAKSK
ncbi:MAG: hypothetical protein CMG50_03025 [Candidatus Marinimicrobia bacterium]|nr:hypothetical protein [Candidatus Neomarinimicrobiota bacterium]